ncbi:MAG: methylenetetrahydrofolate--tRNA-(uracil(54)-C(5))-methyltransferase (FADH(2)-oxidizing) TrmFO [Desulfovermiculus sp.]|nr:methylenetetrahydrofolate--tRNA-(uracil(54)-C(5))-methyltransferase (FADH(2)-oxidizing) TrmFO [Desulfovermiculus sp.]
MKPKVALIGGGLAGCEAAWQLHRAGVNVAVYEMKPQRYSPAHSNPNLAELVCSNSFRSDVLCSAPGLLKSEMRRLDSLIMAAAEKARVPAGKALAVDRAEFAASITDQLDQARDVDLIRREIASLSDPVLSAYSRVIVAAGPLASPELTSSLLQWTKEQGLSFYDAIAPIVSADSINWDRVFWGSRYDPESRDYLNCPLNEEEYHALRHGLLTGERVLSKDFENQVHFEGCLPVETMAERGEMTLAFGPLKPVGLTDPRTGERPFAVVQLRAENKEKTMFNLVGFQTKLTYAEQKRFFRLIPGLEQAEFLRLGSIHRNTFVHAPRVLTPNLELKKAPGVFLAGQITGVEGYIESAACGLWLGLHLGQNVPLPPEETALGGLLNHLRKPEDNFQPMNVNFGLLPPLKGRMKKAKRKEAYVHRAQAAFEEWMGGMGQEAMGSVRCSARKES